MKVKQAVSEGLIKRISTNIKKYKNLYRERLIEEGRIVPNAKDKDGSLQCTKILINELDDMNGSSEKYSYQTIKAWENCHRMPPLTVMIALTEIFGCSLGDLTGEIAYKKKEENEDAKTHIQRALPIDPQDFCLYDGEPVWVESRVNAEERFWALLDYKHHGDSIKLIAVKGIAQWTSNCCIYASKPSDVEGIEHEDFERLKLTTLPNAGDTVYVVSTSADPYIKEKFTGYFKNMKQYRMLVNPQTGLALPYTGIGLSFHAYKL